MKEKKEYMRIIGIVLSAVLVMLTLSVTVMAAQDEVVKAAATDNKTIEQAPANKRTESITEDMLPEEGNRISEEKTDESMPVMEKHAEGIEEATISEAEEATISEVEEATVSETGEDTKKEEEYNVSIPVFTEDGKVIIPRPVKDGKVFIEWNTKKDGTGKRYMPGQAVEPEGLLLFSIWEDETKNKTLDESEAETEETSRPVYEEDAEIENDIGAE